MCTQPLFCKPPRVLSHFWINALCLVVFYYANPLVSNRNITFDVYSSDLHPLFQEHV
jgi:hypothetical protein